MKNIVSAFCLLFISANISAQNKTGKEQLLIAIEKNKEVYADIAKKIWEYAELGYEENKSSLLLQEQLEKDGFSLKKGLANIPTAFLASYGSGKPVIAILAEFDALPGMSQAVVPEQKALLPGAPGHACGHNLFGAGSVAAVVAVKEWLQKSGTKGTIRLYGTPAEEGGAGKVYLVRAGLFNDVDITLHWHASDENNASARSSLALKSAKFRFYGKSAHAARSPHLGRSALDGVEAMNNMVNMMREHIPSDTRIHYAITYGGEAPNVVPSFAEVYYYVRHPEADKVKEIFNRVVKAAEGAAMGTETRMDYELIHGTYNLLINETVSTLADKNFRNVGGITYSTEERAFAKKIQTTLAEKPAVEEANTIKPFVVIEGGVGNGASTDVGDVSWITPTAGLYAATWVPGTASHSWQSAAASGTTIGVKGMIAAAKTLALTAYDLFFNPSIVDEAKKEFLKRRGTPFKYESLVGDRKPPLDFRKKN